MLTALVQDDFDISLQHIRSRMAGMNSHAEVVTLQEGGSVVRASFGEVVRRADRLANALAELGIRPGDRVATLAWNSQQHLEAYIAIPCMGAVLHTLNLRLFEEQLSFIVNHAQDRVIILDDSLVPLLEKVLDQIGSVEYFIVVGEGSSGSLPNVVRYEELLADQDEGFDYPRIDGATAASLCYTSGTTGNPRGVLYGHRSSVLHAMGTCLGDTFGMRSGDRVLPVVPMFHANAWGIPYAAGLIGASLVMPGRFLQAAPLARLIEQERVTMSAAVPTIWMDLLRECADRPASLRSVRRVMCGGAAVPRSLMERFEEKYAIPIVQGYGMTETSPLAAVAEPPVDASGEDERWTYRTRTGRISPLVEARITGDDGGELPWDGESSGELELRGPWIASGYYENAEATAERMHDGWLRTGDIATIDPRGYIQITDRAKDVIKSGGEWISSVELENALMGHPAVLEAAVIAKPDERWTERPLACVVVDPGARITAEDLNEHLAPLVAKWWLPDEYAFIDEVPKTSVGKFDKKVLRRRLAEGELQARVTLHGAAARG
jgi:fatty-acyl-CoA synthase